GEANEIFLRRAGLQEGAAEQRQIGQERLVENMEVKAQIKIDDPERWQVMTHEPRTSDLAILGGDGADITIEIGEGQGRDPGEVFRLVDRLLQRLETLGLGNRFAQGVFVEP